MVTLSVRALQPTAEPSCVFDKCEIKIILPVAVIMVQHKRLSDKFYAAVTYLNVIEHTSFFIAMAIISRPYMAPPSKDFLSAQRCGSLELFAAVSFLYRLVAARRRSGHKKKQSTTVP